MHDQDHPRGFWKIARVERTLAGKDGHVRGAVLRLPSKNGRPTTLQRPLQLLYPLEINHTCDSESSPQPDEQHSQTDGNIEDCEQDEPPARPDDDAQTPPRQATRRSSALRAQDKFKVWASDLLENADDDNR